MGVRTGLAALVALPVVAAVAVDPGGAAPFGPTRWWLTSTLSLIGSGLAVRHGRAPLHRATFVLWAALLGMLTIGTLANDDIRVALLGHPVRHFGLLTWLLCLLVFAAGQQLRATADLRRLVRAATVALAGVGLWCGWELAFGRPIDVGVQTDRLLGPFGSAAILGAACCLFVPVAAGLAGDRDERPAWRTVAAAATLAGLVALVGSGTRAAGLGLVGATVALMIRRRPSRRMAVAVGAAVVISAALLSPRLADVFARDRDAGSRLDEWELAIDVLVDHPLTGVGPEGYRIAVMGHVDAAYERAYGRDVVLPDRAHQNVLDVALQGGLLAGLAYVGLLGLVAIVALRRAATAPTMVVGLAGGVVAYAAQHLLLFPLSELDPLFWLFAGVLAGGLARPAAQHSVAQQPGRVRVADRAADADIGSSPGGTPFESVTSGTERPTTTGQPRARRDRTADAPASVDVWHGSGGTARRTVGAVALIASLPVFVAGLLGVAADRLARSAVAAPTADEGVRDLERAVRLRPDDLGLRSYAVRVHLERGTLADIDDAIDHADAALRWSPDDPIALDDHGGALLARAIVTGTPADVERSLDAWRSLVERDPTRARWQVEFGRAAALAGDRDVARDAWRTALGLRPDDDVVRALLAALDGS